MVSLVVELSHRLCAGYRNKGLQHTDLPPGSVVDNPEALHARFRALWTRTGPPNKRRLTPVLHRLLWRPFYLSAFLLFVYTVCQLGQPLILERLLSYLESSGNGVDGDSESRQHG